MPQQGIDWEWLWPGDVTPVETERVERLVSYYLDTALRAKHEADLLTRSHATFVQETLEHYTWQVDRTAMPCVTCEEVHTDWCPTVLGCRYTMNRSLYHQICNAATTDVNRSLSHRHRELLRRMIDLARTASELHDLRARLLQEAPVEPLQRALDRDRDAVLPQLLSLTRPDF